MAQGTRGQEFDGKKIKSLPLNPGNLESVNPVFNPITHHYFEVCCENALGTLANQIYTGQEIRVLYILY
jgi:hypothetical protein